eukprot:CAMPEP_0197072652 /NCGR_PEP_ID=MMETSP1384-20130603/210205_1 /TAXON_ID=29189 /ORGANISM="Ammonia sp." /LENGTH=641 /DNA_ID=CAMNT_0042511473 /DNA_START=53 /DNA_END=1978 /DNA_ORIENTATION=+
MAAEKKDNLDATEQSKMIWQSGYVKMTQSNADPQVYWAEFRSKSNQLHLFLNEASLKEPEEIIYLSTCNVLSCDSQKRYIKLHDECTGIQYKFEPYQLANEPEGWLNKMNFFVQECIIDVLCTDVSQMNARQQFNRFLDYQRKMARLQRQQLPKLLDAAKKATDSDKAFKEATTWLQRQKLDADDRQTFGRALSVRNAFWNLLLKTRDFINKDYTNVCKICSVFVRWQRIADKQDKLTDRDKKILVWGLNELAQFTQQSKMEEANDLKKEWHDLGEQIAKCQEELQALQTKWKEIVEKAQLNDRDKKILVWGLNELAQFTQRSKMEEANDLKKEWKNLGDQIAECQKELQALQTKWKEIVEKAQSVATVCNWIGGILGGVGVIVGAIAVFGTAPAWAPWAAGGCIVAGLAVFAHGQTQLNVAKNVKKKIDDTKQVMDKYKTHSLSKMEEANDLKKEWKDLGDQIAKCQEELQALQTKWKEIVEKAQNVATVCNWIGGILGGVGVIIGAIAVIIGAPAWAPWAAGGCIVAGLAVFVGGQTQLNVAKNVKKKIDDTKQVMDKYKAHSLHIQDWVEQIKNLEYPLFGIGLGPTDDFKPEIDDWQKIAEHEKDLLMKAAKTFELFKQQSFESLEAIRQIQREIAK